MCTYSIQFYLLFSDIIQNGHFLLVPRYWGRKIALQDISSQQFYWPALWGIIFFYSLYSGEIDWFTWQILHLSWFWTFLIEKEKVPLHSWRNYWSGNLPYFAQNYVRCTCLKSLGLPLKVSLFLTLQDFIFLNLRPKKFIFCRQVMLRRARSAVFHTRFSWANKNKNMASHIDDNLIIIA